MNHLELLDKCSLNSYWKMIDRKGISTGNYYHITKLVQQDIHGAWFEGEQLNLVTGSYYRVRPKDIIFDFDFDKERLQYLIEISEAEYEKIKTEIIEIHQITNSRQNLIYPLHETRSFDFNSLMLNVLEQHYDFNNDGILRCIQLRRDGVHSNATRLIEIDTRSLIYKSADNTDWYVNGELVAANGENFVFKVRILSNYNVTESLSDLELITGFDDDGQWVERVATKDQYTNGRYTSSLWADGNVHILSKHEFNVLKPLVKFS